jgi:hypothetical protein
MLLHDTCLAGAGRLDRTGFVGVATVLPARQDWQQGTYVPAHAKLQALTADLRSRIESADAACTTLRSRKAAQATAKRNASRKPHVDFVDTLVLQEMPRAMAEWVRSDVLVAHAKFGSSHVRCTPAVVTAPDSRWDSPKRLLAGDFGQYTQEVAHLLKDAENRMLRAFRAEKELLYCLCPLGPGSSKFAVRGWPAAWAEPSSKLPAAVHTGFLLGSQPYSFCAGADTLPHTAQAAVLQPLHDSEILVFTFPVNATPKDAKLPLHGKCLLHIPKDITGAWCQEHMVVCNVASGQVLYVPLGWTMLVVPMPAARKGPALWLHRPVLTEALRDMCPRETLTAAAEAIAEDVEVLGSDSALARHAQDLIAWLAPSTE